MNWIRFRPQHLVLLIVWGSTLISLLEVNAVSKPVGLFASSGAETGVVFQHSELRGVLVRVLWSSIETAPGDFNFSALDQQLETVVEAGSQWSMAVVAGGLGSPDWLIDTFEVPYVDYVFSDGGSYKLPLFWDDQVQVRLGILADALAARYGARADLALVYVPQMTSNGIEGHLQRVDMSAMIDQGYTDDLWVDAAKGCARNFAGAFLNKALAIEVHEVNGGVTVPSRIINELWAEPGLEHRVGAAMWWLSGRTDYQANLINVLTAYPGDIYAQVIGRSNQPTRFSEAGYAEVFEQAKAIGIRYIEPWEYEFKNGSFGANGLWDSVFQSFNTWADANYSVEGGMTGRLGPPRIQVTHDLVELRWLGIQGQTYNVEFSVDLDEWLPLGDLIAEESNWVTFPIERTAEGEAVVQSRGFYRIHP